MVQIEFEDFCELEVKCSCVSCEFISFCNGRWRNGTRHGASVEPELTPYIDVSKLGF